MTILSDKQIFEAIRDRKGAPLTQADVDAINAIMHSAIPSPPLAWGAKVAPEFRDKTRAISGRLECDPSDLMTCMAWESGRSFSASKKNMAGSGATGLIQFMPATAQSLGTTTAALAAMTALQQLDWVEKYFQPYKGKLHNLADLYMAILWPAGVGKPLEYVLWDQDSRPTTYRQNAGLDANKDEVITKAECSAKLYAMKAEGQRAENLG
jgi:soluble lytic murein transglycosylase-like protein